MKLLFLLLVALGFSSTLASAGMGASNTWVFFILRAIGPWVTSVLLVSILFGPLIFYKMNPNRKFIGITITEKTSFIIGAFICFFSAVPIIKIFKWYVDVLQAVNTT